MNLKLNAPSRGKGIFIFIYKLKHKRLEFQNVQICHSELFVIIAPNMYVVIV